MENPATLSVTLQRIVIDPTIQPRLAGIEPEHVRELVEAGPDAWPELVVAQIGDELILVDGRHRYEAGRQVGLEVISVRVVPPPADGDLSGLAFRLNAIHGKHLTTGDRRAEAERLLHIYPQLADREIARRCGLAANTVGALRTRLEEAAQIEQSPVRVGADGRSYAVPTRHPGELPETPISEEIADKFDLVRGKTERRQQRRIASYLDRLAVTLDDQQRLSGWDTPADAVAACRAHVPHDEIPELAERLGSGARRVIEVAALLKKRGAS